MAPLAGSGRRLGFTGWPLALCCLAAAFEGYDLQAPGVTLPDISAGLHLAAGQKGLFLSIGTFGLMLGAAMGGRASDRFGRRTAVVGAVALFGLLSLCTALARTPDAFLLARFLTGLGLGGALPNLVAIVTETTRPERRFAGVGVLYACLPAGGALASLVSALVAHPSGWPVIYGLGGAVPLLVSLGLQAVLPPLRARGGPKAPRSPVGAALFGSGRAGSTLLLWLAFFTALLALYLLLSWLPSLLVQRGLPARDAYLVQVAFNLAGALGSAGAGALLDRARTRAAVAAGAFALSCLAIALLAVAPATLLLMAAAGALVGAFVSADQAVIYALAPSFYPREVRGTGVGSAVAAGRLGSAVGPLLGGLLLLGANQAPGRVLLALLPILAISGCASLLLIRRSRPVGGS